MLTGHLLLGAAAVSAGAGTVAAAVSLRGSLPERVAARLRWLGDASALVTVTLTAAAVALMLALLAVGDYSVRYVWQHSGSLDPLWRRLGALLAGEEGSFLVWALAASAVAGWTARRCRHPAWAGRSGAGAVHLVSTGVAFGVVLLAAASAPFEAFTAAFPSLDGAGPPGDGRGLNPVLANPWMPPHTLATFIAYALIGLGFAIAVVELLRAAQGRRDEVRRWARPALLVTRAGWLALSVALLTGVVWAYEEMTFGWFWSWDPVEAASLSVWLLLTAALHARGRAGVGGRALVVGPALSGLAFVAVVFASFVTRSGLHPSVHAFASGEVGSYLGVALAALVAIVGALGVTAWRRNPPGTAPRSRARWAVWPLASGAAVVTWGLSAPMVAGALGLAQEIDTGFFNLAGAVLAVATLLLLGYGLQARVERRREALVTLAVFAGLTAALALWRPGPGLELVSLDRSGDVGGLHAWLGQASLLVFAPPAAYALLGVAEHWWREIAGASPTQRAAATGRALAHLGAVLAFVGATFATLLSSSVTVGVDAATGAGSAGDIEVHLSGVETTERHDATGTLVVEREATDVTVSGPAGAQAAGEAALSTYPERDMGRHAEVLVDRGWLTDTQVVYHGLAQQRPDGIPVTVRRIPLISLLWGGLALLVTGMALVLAADGRSRPAPAPQRRSGPTAEAPARAPEVVA